MPKFVAYLIALVLVCDMAVLGVNYLADETTLITDAPPAATATQPPGPAPEPGQAFVTGQADRSSADDASPVRSASRSPSRASSGGWAGS